MPADVSNAFDVAFWFADTALNENEYLQPQKLQRLELFRRPSGRVLLAMLTAFDHGSATQQRPPMVRHSQPRHPPYSGYAPIVNYLETGLPLERFYERDGVLGYKVAEQQMNKLRRRRTY